MNRFMALAVREAEEGIRAGHGGPFGCVIVRDGAVIGRGHNEVIRQQDPTCHGEIMAIHDACKASGSFDLSGCELYTTAAPCPMCRGAILWANIRKVYFGCTVADTAAIGFRDQEFYEGDFDFFEETDRAECLAVFEEYRQKKGRRSY